MKKVKITILKTTFDEELAKEYGVPGLGACPLMKKGQGVNMNISLREWSLSDANDLMVAINNKKVLDNLRNGIPFPYTEKDAVEYINSVLDAPKDSQYAFAITLDGKAIGSIGAFRQSNIHSRTAEMGYYIAEDYWDQGITTRAVGLLCDFIFTNTDIIRIYAEPFAHNTASCRVLEKSGFIYEGTLRSNAVKNDRVIDMKIYARIKDILI